MFHIRTRLAVVALVAGFAVSGCASTGTNATNEQSSKSGTAASTQKGTSTPTPTEKGTSSSTQKGTSSSTQKGTSAGTQDGTATGTQKSVRAPKPSQPRGALAGSGDVKLSAIAVDAKLGTPSAAVTITNHSSKASNYIVDVSITTSDGKTQLDAAMVSAKGLAPGQTTKKAAKFTTAQKLPKGAKLKIVSIARLVA